MSEVIQTVLKTVNSKSSDIEKYLFLVSLSVQNPAMFFEALQHSPSILVPLVYTPTIGTACLNFSHLFPFGQKGLVLSIHNKGDIKNILRSVGRDVKAIVVTDAQRILGLGDLGINGHGIPIGKLALYTALAGVPPSLTLPITLDVGTNNALFLNDPTYKGNRHKRIQGAEYDSFIQEFMSASNEVFDGPLIQFEDFGNNNAFRVLKTYRNNSCVFNDDIEGTASVVLSGILTSQRVEGVKKLNNQVFLFLGAGEAGTGIAELISLLISKSCNKPIDEARKQCWLIDSKGLVVSSSPKLAHHKIPFAHNHVAMKGLLNIIKDIKPTALIGVSSQPGSFTKDVIQEMAKLNKKPIIFALSNPTKMSECTAKQCYTYSNGRAIFASGSPFLPLTINNQYFVPGQANNSYIFAAVGLGLVWSHSKHCNTEMFLIAAEVLSTFVTDEDINVGSVYPPLSKILIIARAIATKIAMLVKAKNWNRNHYPNDEKYISDSIGNFMYTPKQSKI